MALKPEKEVEVSTYCKDVSPGFVYDFSTKEYFPGDKMDLIKVEQCIPEYVIKVYSKEDLTSMKDLKVFGDALWTKDFDGTKFSDCILLKGQKVCEHKGNVEPHQNLNVVSSVSYIVYIDMFITFKNQIDEKSINELESYTESVISMKMSEDNLQNTNERTGFSRCESGAMAFIPDCISTAFSSGYIYEKGNRTEISAIKHGLEEFCRYLVQTPPFKFPVKCKVKCPLHSTHVSYASVVKKESTVTAHDHPLSDKSYNLRGLSASVAHTVKSSLGSKLPETHNKLMNAKGNSTNSSSSQHTSQGSKLPETHNKLMNAKGNSTNSSFSQHTSQGSKLPETHNKLMNAKGNSSSSASSQHTSQGSKLPDAHNRMRNAKVNSSSIPQDDAQIHSSRYTTRLQSHKNLTREPECAALNMNVPKNSNKSDNLKLKDSSVQNSALENKIQEKSDFPHSHGGNVDDSKKLESVIEKSQLKSVHETVNTQVMSEKPDKSDVSGFNSSNAESSSTLLKPLKISELCGMTRKYYGVIPKDEGKTIILLGASGSGKTTLVNFIANYFSGNKTAGGKLASVARSSNDIQGHTTQITGYTFCASEDDSPLTIIDTPGLNDSSGAEVHDHVQSLKTFLANADSQNLKIHAIGFVAQAHIVRLTSSERLVMNYISSLFGKEPGKNVISLITFSDSQETPPVVEAINSYGVNCSIFLKFNNSALSSNKDEEIDVLDKIYWRIGCKSLKKCIKLLKELPPISFKSLTDEIYVTQFMEMAERDLRSEIMGFLNHHRKKKVITDVLKNAEKVWTLAETVKELKCINAPVCSVVDILLSHVEEICTPKNSSLTPKECIKLISLSPSRPLLKAGLAVISSIGPLYKQTLVQPQYVMHKENIPDALFCHQCNEDHTLERFNKSEKEDWISKKKEMVKSYFRKSSIIYKCTKCSCDGGLHGDKETESKRHEVAESYRCTSNKLLQHTRNCIEKLLDDLCLPEHKIQVNEYIKYLQSLGKQEAQKLCIDLLKMTN